MTVPFALRVLFVVVAVFLARHCWIDGVRTWRLPSGAQNASEWFYFVFFRWFWTALRFWWAVNWLAFGALALIQWSWALWSLMGFPGSFVVGLLITRIYVPWARPKCSGTKDVN